MKYPPRLQSIVPGSNENWMPEVGPSIREQVPADPGARMARDYDLVHFDLDPKNSEPA